MIGLIISGIYALILLVTGETNGYVLFSNFAMVLSCWYLFTTPIIAAVYFGFMKRYLCLELTSSGGLFLVFIFALIRGCLILGSYLLYRSLSLANGEYHWNFAMLAVGLMLVVLFAFVGKITITKGKQKWELNI